MLADPRLTPESERLREVVGGKPANQRTDIEVGGDDLFLHEGLEALDELDRPFPALLKLAQ